MKSALQKIRATVRRAPAFAFGLWLAGAGCAFCCEGSILGASHVAAHAAAHESQTTAAMSSSSSCPLHAQRQTQAREASGEARMLVTTSRPAGLRVPSCCVKGWQPSDAARKPRVTPERAAALPSEEFLQALASTAFVAAPDARGRLPDRGGTYVRVCSFLI
jgi:hypothetical protein